ncbi:hypothetical protein ACA910_011796 [Epithemia clementina (nom. ined.)]
MISFQYVLVSIFFLVAVNVQSNPTLRVVGNTPYGLDENERELPEAGLKPTGKGMMMGDSHGGKGMLGMMGGSKGMMMMGDSKGMMMGGSEGMMMGDSEGMMMGDSPGGKGMMGDSEGGKGMMTGYSKSGKGMMMGESEGGKGTMMMGDSAGHSY